MNLTNLTPFQKLNKFKCRTCKHPGQFHDGYRIVANQCMRTDCHCKELVPLDNLDYVEWLAEKRGLIK